MRFLLVPAPSQSTICRNRQSSRNRKQVAILTVSVMRSCAAFLRFSRRCHVLRGARQERGNRACRNSAKSPAASCCSVRLLCVPESRIFSGRSGNFSVPTELNRSRASVEQLVAMALDEDDAVRFHRQARVCRDQSEKARDLIDAASWLRLAEDRKSTRLNSSHR